MNPMNMNTPIAFKKIDERAVIPQRANSDDAGLDLTIIEDCTVFPGTTSRVRTGLACAIPRGYVGHIHPRSSMFFRGLDLDGVIDSGYRGELQLQICNQGNEAVLLVAGTRVAQMIIHPIYLCAASEVTELPESERGEGGFGSSGK